MLTLSPAATIGAQSGSVVTLTVGRQRAPETGRSQDQRGDNAADAGSDQNPGAAAHSTSSFDVADAYDAHAGELFGFAINALRDRSAAEECVQDAFVRAWRARAGYEPSRSSVRTWLFAIIRNLVRDRHRAQSRAPLLVGTEELAQNPGAQRDPVERLAILEALATLSREHRQAVVAIHLVGMSYAELSESSGVPVATLRTRTFHGLRALRRHFEEGEARDD